MFTSCLYKLRSLIELTSTTGAVFLCLVLSEVGTDLCIMYIINDFKVLTIVVKYTMINN